MIHAANLHALVRRNLEHRPDFHAVRHDDLDAAVGENRALTAEALERGRKCCLGAHRFQLEKLPTGAPFLDEVRDGGNLRSEEHTSGTPVTWPSRMPSSA